MRFCIMCTLRKEVLVGFNSVLTSCLVDTSFANSGEVDLAVALCRLIRRYIPSDWSLCFVTPYLAQEALLKERCERVAVCQPSLWCRLPKHDRTFVHTIDSCQGKEFDIVVNLYVRSEYGLSLTPPTHHHLFPIADNADSASLGFFRGSGRCNVAWSRAKVWSLRCHLSPTCLPG